MSFHNGGISCNGCETLLNNAHPNFRAWFYKRKNKFPDLHIAVTYRDEKTQNDAVAEGKSRLKFPQSAHNWTHKGSPCSRAVDIFQINKDFPGGKWDGIFCAQINDLNKQEKEALFWGGEWKTLGDNDHFQFSIDDAEYLLSLGK